MGWLEGGKERGKSYNYILTKIYLKIELIYIQKYTVDSAGCNCIHVCMYTHKNDILKENNIITKEGVFGDTERGTLEGSCCGNKGRKMIKVYLYDYEMS